MTNELKIELLSGLADLPYLNDQGELPNDLAGKIGVYAIFNQDKILQFIGYSRNIALSLKQHFVRQSQNCYWLKVKVISRPSRTLLEDIKQAWLQENGTIPIGNSENEAQWTQPIDAKLMMTSQEKKNFENTDELGKIKLLKQVSRKVEEQIKEQLQTRGFKEAVRFNPKLKEQGLLDLKD